MAEDALAGEHVDAYYAVRRQYRIAAAVALAALGAGTTFYHLVEHFTWLNAVYFCTITLTTVGYGDLVPKTDAGKLFTIFYVLAGIGIIGYFVDALVKHAVVRRELRRERRQALSQK